MGKGIFHRVQSQPSYWFAYFCSWCSLVCAPFVLHFSIYSFQKLFVCVRVCALFCTISLSIESYDAQIRFIPFDFMFVSKAFSSSFIVDSGLFAAFFHPLWFIILILLRLHKTMQTGSVVDV